MATTARVIGREALLAETKKALASKDNDWDSVRVKDIRVIQLGPLALAQVDLSFRQEAGKVSTASMLCLMVKKGEKWSAVANVTPLADIAAKP